MFKKLLIVSSYLLSMITPQSYFKVITNQVTYNDSILGCDNLNWDGSDNWKLASIIDEEENNEIKNLIADVIPDTYEVWIGLNDIDSEGNWVWSDDSTLFYTNWDQGQPDNYNLNEDCVVMNYAISIPGTWNDYSCDGLLPYVCINLNPTTQEPTPTPTPAPTESEPDILLEILILTIIGGMLLLLGFCICVMKRYFNIFIFNYCNIETNEEDVELGDVEIIIMIN